MFFNGFIGDYIQDSCTVRASICCGTYKTYGGETLPVGLSCSVKESMSRISDKIQGDGRKFLDRSKSYSGSQISSQSLTAKIRNNNKKGDFFFFIYFCL